MRYVVYAPNGQITKIVDCPEDIIEYQLSDGEQYLPSINAIDDKYYVENNVIVEMPQQPFSYCIFDYSTKQWIDPRTPETQWQIVRQQRDLLLQQSDYTQLSDVPLDNKSAWATYRQELRDVTNQPDPFNIVWPVPPA